MDANKAFAVLDLPFGASLEDVDRAYEALVKIWDPHRLDDAELQQRAASKRKHLDEAHSILAGGKVLPAVIRAKDASGMHQPIAASLPLLALLVAAVAVAVANVAIFGASAERSNLESLSSYWIDQLPAAGAIGEDVLAIRDAAARLKWMAMGVLQTAAFVCAILYFARAICQDSIRPRLAFGVLILLVLRHFCGRSLGDHKMWWLAV